MAHDPENMTKLKQSVGLLVEGRKLAQAVIDNWSTNRLAQSVNNLETWALKSAKFIEEETSK